LNVAPTCPFCEQPALQAKAVIRYRRGHRVLAVETVQWQCPSGCAGPEGESPFVFADLATMKRNEEAAQRAWQERFGEPMPAPRRSGRPTEQPHTERLQVRMTPAELDVLDAARGELSRSEYVRRLILGADGARVPRPGRPRSR
jgi:hypothetical protein